MNDHPQQHAKLIQKVLTESRWAAVLRLTAQVISWLSTIIVIRFISPEDYGLNAMLSSPIILMLLLSTLGLDTALVQSKKLDTETLQSTFGWLLVINVVLFSCYFFGGGLLAAYFHEPRLETLAKALSFIFLLVPLRVIPNALLDRDLQFKLRAKLEVISSVTAALLTLTLAYNGAGVWALILGFIANKLILSILLLVFKPWFIFPKLDIGTARKMISTGGIVTLGEIFALSSDMLATLVAGPRLGVHQIGIYVVVIDFASLPLSKGMPVIKQTMLPAFSKLQDHRDSAAYYLEKLLGVASLIFVPILVGLACIAETLVLTVLGTQWKESIVPLIAMSLGMIFRMNNQLLITAITSMGRADISLKSNFIQFSVLLPLTIYAANYGITPLAISWAIAELAVAVVTILMGKKTLGTGLIRVLRCYRPAILSSSIMAICAVGIQFLLGNQNDLIVLFSGISVGVASYYLATSLLYPRELQTALSTVFGDRFLFLLRNKNKIK